MLSWRRVAVLGALMTTLGCESAHIKDAYISRDEDGIRKTDCLQPQWQEYFLIIEMLSFKEDTLVWPYIYCLQGDCRDPALFGRELGPNGLVAPPWQEGEDELVQFGNLAPGKTGNEASLISLKYQELTVDQATGQVTVKDLTNGIYEWRIWIDDEDEPREVLPVTVNPGCPCENTAIGIPGSPGCF